MLMKLVLLLLPSFHSSQTCFKIKTLLYSVVHISAFDHLPEPEMLFLLPINWLLSGDKGLIDFVQNFFQILCQPKENIGG